MKISSVKIKTTCGTTFSVRSPRKLAETNHYKMTFRSYSTPKDIPTTLNIRPEDDRLDVGVGTDFSEEYDGRINVDLVRKNRKRRNQPVFDVHSHFFPNQPDSEQPTQTETKK